MKHTTRPRTTLTRTTRPRTTITLAAIGVAVAACAALPVSVVDAAPRSDQAAATAKADAAIQERLTAIGTLQGLLQGVTHSECQAATMSAQLVADATGLTALQAEIDALPEGTTAQEFKALSGQIAPEYRIYMLQTPKANTVVACDKVFVAADLLDVQAARDEAIAAVNGVIGLTADGGDVSVQASNKAALRAARADLHDAVGLLKAARDAAA
ncbi:MAG: hypothetical protein HY828_03150 [Actinobacteria bacterium]|nr:hypothetical protein [Actinomycetota bacterium]